MKTKTILLVAILGIGGYFLFKRWKAGVTAPAIVPLTPYQERIAAEYSTKYEIPIETMVKLVKAMPVGAWGPIPGIY